MQVHDAPGQLQIIDHGPGMQQVPRPFGGDRSTGGVGLGLHIAQGFTEALGGVLHPTATPGSGLTMTVTLPE